MLRRLILLAGIIIIFLLGIWTARTFTSFFQSKKEEKATILLESIKNVSKLIAVEGYFSEIYDYKEYYGFDIFLFRKKALVRVKAKVSIGYDLEKMKVEAKTSEKKIIIGQMPPPQILSIDHDLDYYDVTEGVFNGFTPEDYNKINKNAKDFIAARVKDSELFKKAEEQKNKVMESIKSIVEAAGWTVEFNGQLRMDNGQF